MIAVNDRHITNVFSKLTCKHNSDMKSSVNRIAKINILRKEVAILLPLPMFPYVSFVIAAERRRGFGKHREGHMQDGPSKVLECTN